MVVVRVPDGLLPAEGAPDLEVVDGRPVYNYSHGSFLGNILRHKYKVEVRSTIIGTWHWNGEHVMGGGGGGGWGSYCNVILNVSVSFVPSR